jgi:hypothetical protein
MRLRFFPTLGSTQDGLDGRADAGSRDDSSTASGRLFHGRVAHSRRPGASYVVALRVVLGVSLALAGFGPARAEENVTPPATKSGGQPTARGGTKTAAQRAQAAGAGATSGTFEDLLAAARPLANEADLARLLEPLFAECDTGDELEARQCAGVHRYLESLVRSETYVLTGDGAALSWSAYDPGSRKIELDVEGCLACARPLRIGDKPRFVTTRIPKSIKGGKATGLDVAFHEVAFPDPKSASRWELKVAPRLRVQFVFKVGAPWKSGSGDKSYEGVAFIPLAHRIYDACTGQVAISEPPSQGRVAVSRAEASKLRCPSAGEVELTAEERRAKEEWEALPVQLSTKDVERAMAPVQDKIHDCYVEFEEKGTATVRLVVQGNGKIDEITVLPPFDKTPTGYCVRTAVKTVDMPRFKGEKMLITFPFYLR